MGNIKRGHSIFTIENDTDTIEIPIESAKALGVYREDSKPFQCREKHRNTSPLYSYTINLNMLDYFGIVPALVITILMEHKVLIRQGTSIGEGSDFYVDDNAYKYYSDSIGIQESAIRQVVQDLVHAGVIVEVDTRPVDGVPEVWMVFNNNVLNKLFFNQG